MAGEWRKRAARVTPILVVSADRITATRLGEMLRGLGPTGDIQWSGDIAEAWRRIEVTNPQLMFVEQSSPAVDGLALVKRLRRSLLACRKIPVIMISDEATVGSMRAAQNAGAHEFLVRPFSSAYLSKRLEVICEAPRPWIEVAAYVGPDRRRFNSAGGGPERRTKSAAKPPA